MNPSARLFYASVLSLFVMGWTSSLVAETRVFTDLAGRTIRGELVGVNADYVTIKRDADGQTFTVKASSFSQSDNEFFKQNGLKESASPKAPTTNAGTPASSAPLRLALKVYSGKQETTSKISYEKEQKVAYKVEIKNTESKRDLDKAKGTLIAFAKVIRYNDETQVISREDFDCGVKALEAFTYETKKPVRLHYYPDGLSGLRSSGYIFVLQDAAGKIIGVTASSDTVARFAEAALKLKVNDIVGRDYKFMKDGTTSYID